MKNYFDTSNESEPNDDFFEREENRPRMSLHDAVEYDIAFVNNILNYESITDADKQNIANVINGLVSQLLNTTEVTKDFEDFCAEVMGKEWRNNMLKKWIQRKNNEFAIKWGMPEMFNWDGIFIYEQEKEEDDE